MLKAIKEQLQSKSIFYSEESLYGKPTVIGYDKQFRWRWAATQLNTFVCASDFGDEPITTSSFDSYFDEAAAYAKSHTRGWPRGFQSAVGVIAILLSTDVTEEAKSYCVRQKAGKKWAGFSIPVAVNPTNHESYFFGKNPLWGKIYYPYFRKTIEELTAGK